MTKKTVHDEAQRLFNRALKKLPNQLLSRGEEVLIEIRVMPKGILHLSVPEFIKKYWPPELVPHCRSRMINLFVNFLSSPDHPLHASHNRDHIETVKDLLAFDKNRLLKFRNTGKTGVNALITVLKDCNLKGPFVEN